MKARCIGMVAILEDDAVATNFWEASGNDLFAMGGRLMEEGVLSTVRANGAMLRDAIRNAEEDENEGKEEDDEP